MGRRWSVAEPRWKRPSLRPNEKHRFPPSAKAVSGSFWWPARLVAQAISRSFHRSDVALVLLVDVLLHLAAMQGLGQLLHCFARLVVRAGDQDVDVGRVAAMDDQCVLV